MTIIGKIRGIIRIIKSKNYNEVNSIGDELDRVFDEPRDFFPFPRLKYTFPDPHPWPKDYKFRIALIPMAITLSSFDRVENGELRLLKIKDELTSDIVDIILKLLNKASELGSKIIVFSEFSFPISEYSKLDGELKRFCNETNSFVIAGSFHETRDYDEYYGFSKCPIYHIRNKILYQYKNDPGSFAGTQEVINNPRVRNLQVIQSRYGTFCVSICVDFLDANLHYNLKKLNRKGSLYHPVDFLIIPSYTDNPNLFHQACKKVSSDSNMCIIYVNNFSGDMSPEVFLGGEKMDCEKSDDLGQDIPPIYLYDLDLINVRMRRLFGDDVEITDA